MFGSLKALFSLESGEGKKRGLEKLITTDIKLKEIDAELKRLQKAGLKRAKEDDELLDMLEDIGISPDDLG